MIRTMYRVYAQADKRYVRKSGESYRWCERSAADPAYDVAQGACDADDLPEDVRAKCDAHTGWGYACEWPFPQ